MLALAYAAAHPGRATAIALIGCGTFDLAARDRMRSNREERTDDNLRRRMEHLSEEFPNINDRLHVLGKLIQQLDSWELISTDEKDEAVDAQANQETWQDMMRLQEEEVYPAAFSAIHEPVIMLHGDYDPHPGRMVLTSLEPYLPQLEYREWERCGHYPWLEKAIHDEFNAALREWLALQFTGDPRTAIL
jgi:pimeloyl-ACP methyl ester carboxylesterase